MKSEPITASLYLILQVIFQGWLSEQEGVVWQLRRTQDEPCNTCFETDTHHRARAGFCNVHIAFCAFLALTGI